MSDHQTDDPAELRAIIAELEAKLAAATFDWRSVPDSQLRPGTKVPRNLYLHPGDTQPGADVGRYIGTVDYPDLAAAICEAWNQRNWET